MPITNFDINTLFQQAFGIGRGKPYDASQIKEETIREAGAFEQPVVNDEEGTEFVDMRDVVRASTPYGQRIFMPIQLGGVILPNEPSIEMRRRKLITETIMAGGDQEGSVKELINMGDWEIVIQGIGINYESTKVFPEDLYKQIGDLCDRKESLEIKCAVTALRKVYRLVIVDELFPKMIGVQHAFAYQLVCKSDRDFILEID